MGRTDGAPKVMDLWGLGEGVVPTMRHASKKLLAEARQPAISRPRAAKSHMRNVPG